MRRFYFPHGNEWEKCFKYELFIFGTFRIDAEKVVLYALKIVRKINFTHCIAQQLFKQQLRRVGFLRTSAMKKLEFAAKPNEKLNFFSIVIWIEYVLYDYLVLIFHT